VALTKYITLLDSTVHLQRVDVERKAGLGMNMLWVLNIFRYLCRTAGLGFSSRAEAGWLASSGCVRQGGHAFVHIAGGRRNVGNIAEVPVFSSPRRDCAIQVDVILLSFHCICYCSTFHLQR